MLSHTGNTIRVISPPRVCPLGAHVDHQNGLVSGMALDTPIILDIVPRNDNLVKITSANFEGKAEFYISPQISKSEYHWENYARGAAQALCQKYHDSMGKPKGFEGSISGNLPIGGLGTSAAVSIAYLLALEYINGLDVSRKQNIELGKYVENVYLGLKSGALDQTMVLFGERDSLTFLDCESMSVTQHKCGCDNDYRVVLAYSGLSKSLAVSNDYNNRVKECAIGAKILAELGNIKTEKEPLLGDIPRDVWEEYKGKLPSPIDRRVKHFFTEVKRVEEGVKVWEKGSLEEFGHLINESGESSMYDYESGCPHLITMFEILKNCPGVYGARFGGAGFRGSCIGFVNPNYEEEIRERVKAVYPLKHPEMADTYGVFFSKSGDGARIENIQ